MKLVWINCEKQADGYWTATWEHPESGNKEVREGFYSAREAVSLCQNEVARQMFFSKKWKFPRIWAEPEKGCYRFSYKGKQYRESGLPTYVVWTAAILHCINVYQRQENEPITERESDV